MRVCLNKNHQQSLVYIVFLVFVVLLSGCATTRNDGQPRPIDPLEPMNRKIFYFNAVVDQYAVKPLAMGYRAVTPQPVRTGLFNVFSNFDDFPITVNKLLQLEFKAAGISFFRAVLNSTLGLAGLIDVASPSGLEKQRADLGQTLGIWGIEYSPYLVVPIIGPSTIRDGIGRSLDWYASPWILIRPALLRYGIYAGSGIVYRERLLDAEALFDIAAFDDYVFIRNAYLQQRANLIGTESPDQDLSFDDDFDDDFSGDFDDDFSGDFDDDFDDEYHEEFDELNFAP